LRVLPDAYPDIDAVWYIDLLTETIVVKKSKPNAALWREIETVCDDMLLLYGDLMSRLGPGVTNKLSEPPGDTRQNEVAYLVLPIMDRTSRA
jgi:hypothetical protein